MGKSRLLQAIQASSLGGLRHQADQPDCITLHLGSGDAGHKGQVRTASISPCLGHQGTARQLYAMCLSASPGFLAYQRSN